MYRRMNLCLIILVLSISTGFSEEVGYVFDDGGGHLLSNANLSKSNASEIVTFTTAGVGPTCPVIEHVGELQNDFSQRVESNNPLVRDKAVDLVQKSPGPFTIGQICNIYGYMTENWNYVSDPRCKDYFQYANETLKHGKEGGRAGAGDCDDFAILMAAMVESIGGTTRIIMASSPEASHSYAEVYLGNMVDDKNVEKIINWLKLKFSKKEISTHKDLATGDVWLNLDWGKDIYKAAYPGCPIFDAKEHIPIYINKNATKTNLNPSPIAFFDFIPSEEPSARSPITFDASKSEGMDNIEEYHWEFGDGNSTISKDTTLNYNYYRGGYFRVNLTVTDMLGFENQSSKVIKINNPPTANFTYSPKKPKMGDMITFNAAPSIDIDGRVIGYKWDFGDKYSSEQESPMHAYQESGMYRINLTVTDDKGTKGFKSMVIKVNNPPIANFTNYPQKPNAGQKVIFDASSSNDTDGSIIGYMWDFGDNSTSSETKPVHVYPKGGKYEVKLKVEDNDYSP